MNDNIITNKAESIARCLARVREEYVAAGKDFLTDHSRQDSTILNLQRASQTAIDIAAHVVRLKSLSVPKNTKDLFVALHDGKIITKKTSDRMIAMVGFRNIAVHEYKKIDMNVVMKIIESHITDFEKFIQEILKAN